MIFKSKAYLTIDDSPSTRMDDLVDFLEEKGIPAIFFCRGDLLAENSASPIRALQKGFTLANHAYSHQRASQKNFSWIVDEIESCEALLDEIYAVAGISRREKYFRFPQLDRGTGAWVVDYDTYPPQEREDLLRAFAQGLNVQSMERPDDTAFAKKDRLQLYLAGAGYTQPFKNVSPSWFARGEIAAAHDCLYTYSNCDWMLTNRHLGKWPYKTLEDLTQKALNDPALLLENGVNVVLAHDQAEIVDVTIKLVDNLQKNGLTFID